MKKPYVALAPFLSGCPSVTTLGVRPSLMDYPFEELELLRSAKVVFFPSILYARIFHSAGIPTFPTFTCHMYRSSTLHQAMLLKMTGLPHPNTKIYYGKNRNAQVLRDFSLPFTVLPPFGKTSHLRHEISSLEEFEACFRKWNPLVVQESSPWEKKLSLSCINFQVIGGSLESRGSSTATSLDTHLLKDASLSHPISLTHRLLKAGDLDDIRVEWIEHGGVWRLLFLQRPTNEIPSTGKPLNRFAHICEQIVQGNISGNPVKG